MQEGTMFLEHSIVSESDWIREVAKGSAYLYDLRRPGKDSATESS